MKELNDKEVILKIKYQKTNENEHTIQIPTLKGCIACGNSTAEMFSNLHDVLEKYLEREIEDLFLLTDEKILVVFKFHYYLCQILFVMNVSFLFKYHADRNRKTQTTRYSYFIYS